MENIRSCVKQSVLVEGLFPRITQQANGGNSVATDRVDFTYRADGQFDTIARYANLTGTQLVAGSSYGYDSAGRLTSLTHAKDGTTFAGYQWTYDPGDRVTAFTNSAHTEENVTYQYDGLSQLAGADRSGTAGDEAYTYDSNGNRTNSGYSTGTGNRLLSDGTYNYQYDGEGNTTKRTKLVNGTATGATTEYTYDYRNRQTRVVEKDYPTGTVTKQVDYTYDAFDRRITKTIDADGAGSGAATLQYFVYDGQNIVLNLTSAGTVNHRYLYGEAVDQIFTDESASGVLWALADNQNTPRDLVTYNATTDATTVANHIAYDAFGRVTSETNAAIDFLLGFQGMERDKETGTYHADLREYDPITGSWTQEDKIGFGGDSSKLNAFVGNSPTNFVDPTGLKKVLKTTIDVGPYYDLKGRQYSDQITVYDEGPSLHTPIYTLAPPSKNGKKLMGIEALTLQDADCGIRAYHQMRTTGNDLLHQNADVSMNDAMDEVKGEVAGGVFGWLQWAATGAAGGLAAIFGRRSGQRAAQEAGEEVADAAKRAAKNTGNAAATRAENLAKGIPESKLGPSGKPKVHCVDLPSRKEAKDAARNSGKGKAIHHPNDVDQPPHYHSVDKDGNKIGQQSPHFNYPEKQK